MCFAMYCTYWESGSGSVFIAAFSCLEMGPSEQRQYFTGAWQAAAKVFTAWLQCGKMDPARDAHAARGLRTVRALTRCCLILYIVYTMSFFKNKKTKKKNDRNVERCVTPAHVNAAVALSRWWFCFSHQLSLKPFGLERDIGWDSFHSSSPFRFVSRQDLQGEIVGRKTKTWKIFFVCVFKSIAFWD